jgi:hypothetical protein
MMANQKKVKLSECLWIDLTTFEQKRDFLLLGKGVETGIIAPSMQNVLAHDYNVIVELRKANAELEKEHNTLTEFADWALDAIFTGSDICGDDAQDKMFELGMLTREIYDPEVHTLSQGSECDAGDYIYFKALKAGN